MPKLKSKMKMNCLVNSFVASAIFAGVAIFCTSCQKNELGKSAETIKKLNTDFYYMTVTSDAGFSDFIDRGGASSPDELAAFLSPHRTDAAGRSECQTTEAWPHRPHRHCPKFR